jgi:hypothetical protein
VLRVPFAGVFTFGPVPKAGLDQAAGMPPGVDQFPATPPENGIAWIESIRLHPGDYPEKTILKPHKRLVRTLWGIRHKVNVDPIRLGCGVRIEVCKRRKEIPD